jgi:hypothetical protein
MIFTETPEKLIKKSDSREKVEGTARTIKNRNKIPGGRL